MTVVSTTEFRANQSKILGMVDRGEHVVLCSRNRRYRILPSDEDDAEHSRRDVTEETCRGMKEWKNYLETGASDYFRPAEELLHELRDSDQ